MAFDEEAHKKHIDSVLRKLEEFWAGNKNEIYERFLFNKRDQAACESIDTYVASLRSLSKTCNYGALTDNRLRDRMVVGILDKGIQKKLSKESKLTLQSCIDICRANECTKQQLQTMHQSDEVNAVDEKTSKSDRKPKSKRDPKSGKTPKLINCKFCAKKHEEKKEKCPAWSKTCEKCGAKNHFSVVCNKQRPPPHRKKPRDTQRDRQTRLKVNMVYEQEESDSDDYC